MASGFGWGGGRSRCFTYWQEIQKCYAVADHPAECKAQGADYLECLDNRKEIKRAQTIAAEHARQLQHRAHESHKASSIASSGAIASVGIIQRDGSGGGGEGKEGK
uniref:NADH dehydrogenase [ubiquinone] iron-sulfur protein 5 n=1 Tax=Psilocybe cubensis TaxID=181762 RepID=A0A8H8CJZ4_PSICU